MQARTLFLTFGVAVMACRTLGGNQAPGPDLSQRRSELALTHQRGASRAAAGDFVGAVTGVIAPEGFYGAALATLGKGPEAARTFLMRDTLNARSHALWTVVRLDVSADGNDAYSYGYLDVIRPGGDTLPGAFKAYWRRDGDGAWWALALGRSPRERGPTLPLPDSLQRPATAYKVWPARDSLEARETLMAAEAAFSDSSATNVRAAFMSLAAPDAGKIAGAHYVFGREAIGEGYRTPPPGFNGMKWHAKWGTVSRSNDLGFNVGPVTLGPSSPSQPGRPGGLFFTIWRRQPNGEWKYLVD